MRLDTYLTESRGKLLDIEIEEVLGTIRSKCSQAYKAYMTGNRLYRGIDVAGWEQSFFIEPSKHVRHSRDGSNAYTVFIDNSPMWKSYPKRSQSIICVSDIGVASTYGTPYTVFAVDGSTFGICPNNDIWFSFDSYGGTAITDLIDVYNKMCRVFKFPELPRRPSYSALMSSFDKFDKYWKDNDLNFLLKDTMTSTITDVDKKKLKVSFNVCMSIGEWYKNWMIRFYKGSMSDAWGEFLHPEKNGFRVVKGQQSLPSSGSGREIWTDGNSYLIKSSDLDKIKLTRRAS